MTRRSTFFAAVAKRAVGRVSPDASGDHDSSCIVASTCSPEATFFLSSAAASREWWAKRLMRRAMPLRRGEDGLLGVRAEHACPHRAGMRVSIASPRELFVTTVPGLHHPAPVSVPAPVPVRAERKEAGQRPASCMVAGEGFEPSTFGS